MKYLLYLLMASGVPGAVLVSRCLHLHFGDGSGNDSAAVGFFRLAFWVGVAQSLLAVAVMVGALLLVL